MPSLCDVSFLLPLCHGQHEHHPSAKRHVDAVTNRGEFVVCRMTQLVLLRLLSNPVLMASGACTMKQAWRVCDTLMSDDRFVFQNEPLSLETTLRELTEGFGFSPKLWQDAYLAAFAMTASLELVTFDGGFREFKGLQCLVLR